MQVLDPAAGRGVGELGDPLPDEGHPLHLEVEGLAVRFDGGNVDPGIPDRRLPFDRKGRREIRQ